VEREVRQPQLALNALVKRSMMPTVAAVAQDNQVARILVSKASVRSMVYLERVTRAAQRALPTSELLGGVSAFGPLW
jgi:hypothetical protein